MFYLHVYVMGDGTRVGKISLDDGPIIKVVEGAYFHIVSGRKHVLNIYRQDKKKRPYIAWTVDLDVKDHYKCGVDIPQYDNDPKHDVQARFSYSLDSRYRKEELLKWATSAYGTSKNPNINRRVEDDRIEFEQRWKSIQKTNSQWAAIKKDGKFIPFRKPRLKFLKPIGWISLLPAICFMPEQFFPIGPAFLALSLICFIVPFLVNYNFADRIEYSKAKQKMLDEMSKII